MPSERSTGDVVVLPLARSDSPTVCGNEPARIGDGPMPRKIGRYVVLEVVGKGGMGIVCTAYDPKLDRRIALKLLRDHEVKDARRATTGQARLVREARALARLSHPNIVMVHDVDVVDGRLYIAMEYLEGQSVSQWLDARRRSWHEILEVFVPAARGLAAAHEAGIVHRDFKPANVLLGPGGRVCVVDFGLAKRNTDEDGPGSGEDQLVVGTIDDSMKLTQVGRRVGTPAYMSPEQILGQEVGPAADQFAFGVSLYEALYRIGPFRGHDRQEAMWQAIEGKVSPPPRDHDIPAWLHRVVLRCLAREPEDRYPDMHALITALRDDPARRRSWIRRATIGGGAVVVGAAIVGAMVAGRDPCPGADQRVGELWNDGRRDTLAASFEATGASFAGSAWKRTADAIDARAQTWLATHDAVCEATHVRGEQSDALLDVRMACLERGLRELEVLLELFDAPDLALVERATEAAMRVPDPRRCGELTADDEGSLPAPELAPRVAELGDRLAAATAHMNAGRDAKALEIAEEVWRDVQGLGHPPIEIRARFTRARLLTRTGDSENAEVELRTVIEEAATHRRARDEAQAWVTLVPLLGVARRQGDEALALRFAAEAALRRAKEPADLRADLAHGVAATLLSRGDHAAAIVELERALELRLATLDEHDPDVARTRSDLGVAFVRAGRFEEAEKELVRALADSVAALGADHPVVASLAHNLGNVRLEGRADLEGAAEMFERALTIRERAFGRQHPRVAEILVSLAALRRRTGDYASALATGQRAVTILEAPGKPDTKLALALHALGTTLLALDRPADALAAHERAFDMQKAMHGESHASVGRAHVRMCEALGALARLGEAIGHCTTGIATLEQAHQGPHRETSDALRNAAAVQLEAGHRSVALEYARKAVAMDRALDRPTSERAVAELELLRVLAADPADRVEAGALRDVVEAALERHDDRVFIDRARAWLRTHPR